ncbi:MAG: methylphosphotriester-DNA--protein-cysteine methyltransferase family protein [Sphingomonadaceae bacterium]|nr:methylphosphotriester-DNA--protein-cysteine methyltransferase family protein [Sphingomonadaceae bacterium]
MLDETECREAMARRDARYDGVFYVGVKTTFIYCRPVCKARMPRFENVRFYQTAAGAEAAGFRPCLRCRPEAAPFSPAWKGSKATVDRAMRLIDDGALDRGTVDDLAARLGIGARHLSRLFRDHIGATPTQAAATARLGRAKRMLDDSELTLCEIAGRAGFPSSRSMSTAFLSSYGRRPSQMRRPAGRSAT